MCYGRETSGNLSFELFVFHCTVTHHVFAHRVRILVVNFYACLLVSMCLVPEVGSRMLTDCMFVSHISN